MAVPATMPTGFEIPLCYFSPATETEYRNAGSSPPAIPNLSYKILPISATSEDHTLRADRVGKVVLKPDHDINRMVSVKALIDRVALVVSTKRLTSYQKLHRAITAKSGATVYVADRTIKPANPEKNKWQTLLPELDLSHLTGQHFAIMVQEPTPENLRLVLNAIDDHAGIDGVVRPFLLELALDFYPRNPANPDEVLLQREQIVGLLQPYHWSAGQDSHVHNPDVARTVDRRQVYEENSAKQTRNLFAATSKKIHSDIEVHKMIVRNRLLREKPGNDLYLNATVYQGALNAPRQTNIQHKIADQRNSDKNTLVYLSDDIRRAKIELTLTSLEALEQAGLTVVDDLAQCKFRTTSRSMLGFRLPTCMANGEDVLAAITQMNTRGVYGVEMNQRAQLYEQRQQMTPKPRKLDRDGWALVDWTEMNAMAGAASDSLQRRWQRF